MKDAKPELAYQFEREGYFCRDSEASDSLVFNATFSNISAISWRPVLVVEEAKVPGVVKCFAIHENH
jgi:hypothetical protein